MSAPNPRLVVHRSVTLYALSSRTAVACGALSVDCAPTPPRLWLAPADSCHRSAGATATPPSRPNPALPLPSPQLAFPVGNEAVSAAPITGDQAPGSVRSADATSGRSANPLCATPESERPTS